MLPTIETIIRLGDSRPRILVVDPDPGPGKAVAMALRHEAQVEWVPTGVAGLLTAADQYVDLVIADSSLGDVSSADLSRLLRLLLPVVPIAILHQSGPPRAAEDDAAAWFSKPLDLGRVVAWLRGRLGERLATRPGPLGCPPRGDFPQRQIEIIQRALAFVERHHRDGAPLATIARATGVSRSHLCRTFRRITGIPLKRFLIRHRLQAAKALLRVPGLAITQVARRAGFRDACHFDRVFRQWEGQTPSSYRRQAVQRAARSRHSSAVISLSAEPMPADD